MARSSSKKGEARARLLEAADELFYTEGIHTVGIDRIIEKAGVAKGSLYYIFGSKDELVKAYLENRHGNWTRRVEEHVERATEPTDRMLAVFDALDELFVEPDYHGCAFQRAAAESEEGSVEQLGNEAFRTWLDDLFYGLARDAGVADPKLVGRQLVLLYDGAVGSEPDHASYAPGALAKSIAVTLLDSSPAWQTRTELATAK